MAEDHLFRIDLLLLKLGNRPKTWLARESGIPEGTLNGWWSKQRMPKADQMVQVARALGTTVEYLITGEEQNTEELSPARRRWLGVMDGKTDEEIETALSALDGFLAYYCRS